LGLCYISFIITWSFWHQLRHKNEKSLIPL